MPYKLLKLVCNASFFFSLSFFPAKLYADFDEFSIRGQVPALVSQNIQTMALRPDGRYLFYATVGASSWNAVDLQDMAYLNNGSFSVESPIIEMAVINSTTLVVVTSNGVQRFDISKPYEPNEMTGAYEFPETSLSQSVEAACIHPENGRVFFLEVNSASETDHFLRVVDGATQALRIPWVTLEPLAPSTRQPAHIRCTSTNVILFAGSTVDDEEDRLFIGKVPSATPAASAGFVDVSDTSELNEYSWVDFDLSPNGEDILIAYEKEDEDETLDGARVVRVNVNTLSTRQIRNVGEDIQGIASYERNGQIYYSVFIGQDRLANDEDINKVLTSLDTEFFTTDFGDRGEGRVSIGGRFPTRWFSTDNDHYVYGLAETTGVTVASLAPSIEFVSQPGIQTFNSSETLEFQITSDQAVQYEILFEKNMDEDGLTTGLESSPGILLQSEAMKANTPTTISIVLSSLGVTENRRYSIRIKAISTEEFSSGLASRTGVAFDFDPPPGGISGFRLGTGDQSVHVFFTTPPGGDIKSFHIFFSYTESDLDTLDPESRVEVPTVLDGVVLTSPVELAAENFNKSYVINPLENGTPLFVRVLVEDETGQFSTDNPAALSKTPYATLTLPNALGSAESCALSTARPVSSLPWFFILFVFFLGTILIRPRIWLCPKKLGPAVFRNRRGGD